MKNKETDETLTLKDILFLRKVNVKRLVTMKNAFRLTVESGYRGIQGIREIVKPLFSRFTNFQVNGTLTPSGTLYQALLFLLKSNVYETVADHNIREKKFREIEAEARSKIQQFKNQTLINEVDLAKFTNFLFAHKFIQYVPSAMLKISKDFELKYTDEQAQFVTSIENLKSSDKGVNFMTIYRHITLCHSKMEAAQLKISPLVKGRYPFDACRYVIQYEQPKKFMAFHVFKKEDNPIFDKKRDNIKVKSFDVYYSCELQEFEKLLQITRVNRPRPKRILSSVDEIARQSKRYTSPNLAPKVFKNQTGMSPDKDSIRSIIKTNFSRLKMFQLDRNKSSPPQKKKSSKNALKTTNVIKLNQLSPKRRITVENTLSTARRDSTQRSKYKADNDILSSYSVKKSAQFSFSPYKTGQNQMPRHLLRTSPKPKLSSFSNTQTRLNADLNLSTYSSSSQSVSAQGNSDLQSQAKKIKLKGVSEFKNQSNGVESSKRNVRQNLLQVVDQGNNLKDEVKSYRLYKIMVELTVMEKILDGCGSTRRDRVGPSCVRLVKPCIAKKVEIDQKQIVQSDKDFTHQIQQDVTQQQSQKLSKTQYLNLEQLKTLFASLKDISKKPVRRKCSNMSIRSRASHLLQSHQMIKKVEVTVNNQKILFQQSMTDRQTPFGRRSAALTPEERHAKHLQKVRKDISQHFERMQNGRQLYRPVAHIGMEYLESLKTIAERQQSHPISNKQSRLMNQTIGSRHTPSPQNQFNKLKADHSSYLSALLQESPMLTNQLLLTQKNHSRSIARSAISPADIATDHQHTVSKHQAVHGRINDLKKQSLGIGWSIQSTPIILKIKPHDFDTQGLNKIDHVAAGGDHGEEGEKLTQRDANTIGQDDEGGNNQVDDKSITNTQVQTRLLQSASSPLKQQESKLSKQGLLKVKLLKSKKVRREAQRTHSQDSLMKMEQVTGQTLTPYPLSGLSTVALVAKNKVTHTPKREVKENGPTEKKPEKKIVVAISKLDEALQISKFVPETRNQISSNRRSSKVSTYQRPSLPNIIPNSTTHAQTKQSQAFSTLNNIFFKTSNSLKDSSQRDRQSNHQPNYSGRISVTLPDNQDLKPLYDGTDVLDQDY